LAAQAGYLNILGQYWWHDPHYVSRGNIRTVAMRYYDGYARCKPSKQSEMPPLDQYWWHEPEFQVVTEPSGYGPTVAMLCAEAECVIYKQNDLNSPREI
jgi:hypothetical protein